MHGCSGTSSLDCRISVHPLSYACGCTRRIGEINIKRIGKINKIVPAQSVGLANGGVSVVSWKRYKSSFEK